MQVIKTESNGSFYESFSDLIFCTLVLFILLFLVMALSVDKQITAEPEPVEQQAIPVDNSVELRKQLAQAEQRARNAEIRLAALTQEEGDRSAADVKLQKQERELAVKKRQFDDLLGSNRFVGRSGESRINLAVDISPARGWRYIPYPENLQQEHDVAVNGESERQKKLRQTLARTKFARHSRSARRYTADQVMAIMTDGVQRYRKKDNSAGTVRLTTAGQFSAWLSGALDLNGDISNAEMATRFLTVDRFRELNSTGRNDDDTPKGTLPVLLFELTSELRQPLSCGGVKMSAEDAVVLINSFHGRGVAVEVSPEAPDWFMEQVLRPTGYVNRAPSVTLDTESPQ